MGQMVHVVLDLLRCTSCQRLLFDADIRIHKGCPSCGARTFKGVGRTTPEEALVMEKRALDNYDLYRDYEIEAMVTRATGQKDSGIIITELTQHNRERKTFSLGGKE